MLQRILSLKNDNILQIIDQKKASRVPLWIEHCHLCMEGHFKKRLQSLQHVARRVGCENS